MTLETFLDFFRYAWIVLAIPLYKAYKWFDTKRVEYLSLVQKVDNLEVKVRGVDKKIDANASERQQTSQKIDMIYDLVKGIQTETAVNKARLEERKHDH